MSEAQLKYELEFSLQDIWKMVFIFRCSIGRGCVRLGSSVFEKWTCHLVLVYLECEFDIWM